MATVTRTFELSVEAAAELDRRAAEEHCAPSELLDRMFVAHGELRESDFTPQQWADIQEGIRQADAGEFAPREEVDALFAQYLSPR